LPQISSFLQAIAPLTPAYSHGVFTFVALLHQGEKVLLRGQLRLLVDRSATIRRSLQTTRLFAGQVALDLDAAAAETCLRRAVAGDWLPPLGDDLLKLLPRDQPGISSGYSAYHEPADAQHVRDKGAVERLVLTGISYGQLVGLQLSEVTGDLNELGFTFPGQLFGAYDLRGGGGEDSSFEIIASPVAKIEPESTISGRKARVRIGLACSLSPERLRITSRNADTRVRDLPWTIGGANLGWTASGAYHYAEWQFDLLEDTVLHVRAVYAGRVHAESRLADPASTPNRLWRALEHVDPKLERLQELLTNPRMRDKDARDFETGTTWLLQLLGFTTVYLGDMSRFSGEPDVLAQAPNGDLILVECTIEVPDDGKLNSKKMGTAHRQSQSCWRDH
jgi:hypothetical protein